jgi:hypothetical protein
MTLEPLAEYYYDLEAATSARSSIEIGTNGLEHLDIKNNIDDIFVSALCYKYGIIHDKNIDKYFEILNKIETGVLFMTSWNSININAFVYFQLSEYYLMYKSDIKLHDHYLNLAIQNKHRVAMQEHAEYMYNPAGDTDYDKVISLCRDAIKEGNDEARPLLICCYKDTNNFKMLCDEHQYNINAYMYDENYLNHYCADFNYFKETPEQNEYFIRSLISSKNVHVSSVLKKFDAALLTEIFLKLILEDKKNIDNILYHLKFQLPPDNCQIVDLIKQLCQKIQNI